uniref:Uncharacterized protein n=1 Tax=Anguilla anguilla TaxID=7936 RepID=A0A0E9S2N3_ANGAN
MLTLTFPRTAMFPQRVYVYVHSQSEPRLQYSNRGLLVRYTKIRWSRYKQIMENYVFNLRRPISKCRICGDTSTNSGEWSVFTS